MTSTILGPTLVRPGEGTSTREGSIQGQLEFVRNVLAHTPDDTLVVVVMHIPINTFLDNEPYQNLQDRDAFFALFEGRRYTVSFAGHTHTTEHHYYDGPDGWKGATPHHHHVLTALSGSWWSGPYDHRGVASADSRDGTPNGFHILSVDGLSYATRFVPAKEPNGRQMRLSISSRFHGISKDADRDFTQVRLLGSPVPRDALSASTLIANVFDGGEKTKVKMVIGDRAPIEMTRACRGPIPSCKRCSHATRRRRRPGSRPRIRRTSGSRVCPATLRLEPIRWWSRRPENMASR